MKSIKLDQLLKDIAASEPDEPVITANMGQKMIIGFSVLFTHFPQPVANQTREAYAESLKKFGLEKVSNVPWSMTHTRVIPKAGSVSYTVHFYSLTAVEVEIITDVGANFLNNKLIASAELKKKVEEVRSVLRSETKEVLKILNMIDDPKLKANYGVA